MHTHLWNFSKSKFNLMSDRVNLIAPASPIECPYVRAIQYKLGPYWLTQLGASNVLRLPVRVMNPSIGAISVNGNMYFYWNYSAFVPFLHSFYPHYSIILFSLPFAIYPLIPFPFIHFCSFLSYISIILFRFHKLYTLFDNFHLKALLSGDASDFLLR